MCVCVCADGQTDRQAGGRPSISRRLSTDLFTYLLDVAVAVDLVLVREEEVAVHLVDEHLEADGGVHGVRPYHHLHQAGEGVLGHACRGRGRRG